MLASALLLLTACGPKPGTRAGAGRCPRPFNAGSRLPGFLNPAFPLAGLFPASGALPPNGTPGVTLAVRTRTLVLTYGQALEHGAVHVHDRLVPSRASGAWRIVPLAGGYTFQVFGPAVPLFGVVPAPVLSGRRARGLRHVWVVTQWTATQPITVLQGTAALAAAATSRRQVPPAIDAANLRRAAGFVRQAEAAGWKTVGVFNATPACGATATHLGPFGARASLRLPLGVPLELVAPQYGAMILRLTAG